MTADVKVSSGEKAEKCGLDTAGGCQDPVKGAAAATADCNGNGNGNGNGKEEGDGSYVFVSSDGDVVDDDDDTHVETTDLNAKSQAVEGNVNSCDCENGEEGGKSAAVVEPELHEVPDGVVAEGDVRSTEDGAVVDHLAEAVQRQPESSHANGGESNGVEEGGRSAAVVESHSCKIADEVSADHSNKDVLQAAPLDHLSQAPLHINGEEEGSTAVVESCEITEQGAPLDDRQPEPLHINGGEINVGEEEKGSAAVVESCEIAEQVRAEDEVLPGAPLDHLSQAVDHQSEPLCINGGETSAGEEEKGSSAVVESCKIAEQVRDEDELHSTKDVLQAAPLDHLSEAVDQQHESLHVNGGEAIGEGSPAVVESELCEIADHVKAEDEVHSTEDVSVGASVDHLSEAVEPQSESLNVNGGGDNVGEGGRSAAVEESESCETADQVKVEDEVHSTEDALQGAPLDNLSVSIEQQPESLHVNGGEANVEERGRSTAVVETESRLKVEDEVHSTVDVVQGAPLDHLSEAVELQPDSLPLNGGEANVGEDVSISPTIAGESHGSCVAASELDQTSCNGERIIVENQVCPIIIAGVEGELDSDQAKEPSELINAVPVEDSQSIQNSETSPFEGDGNENGGEDALPLVHAQDRGMEFSNKLVDDHHNVTEFTTELVLDDAHHTVTVDEQDSCPKEVNNLNSSDSETGVAVMQVLPTNHGQEGISVNGFGHASETTPQEQSSSPEDASVVEDEDASIVEGETSKVAEIITGAETESKKLDMDGIVEKIDMNAQPNMEDSHLNVAEDEQDSCPEGVSSLNSTGSETDVTVKQVFPENHSQEGALVNGFVHDSQTTAQEQNFSSENASVVESNQTPSQEQNSSPENASLVEAENALVIEAEIDTVAETDGKKLDIDVSAAPVESQEKVVTLSSCDDNAVESEVSVAETDGKKLDMDVSATPVGSEEKVVTLSGGGDDVVESEVSARVIQCSLDKSDTEPETETKTKKTEDSAACLQTSEETLSTSSGSIMPANENVVSKDDQNGKSFPVRYVAVDTGLSCTVSNNISHASESELHVLTASKETCQAVELNVSVGNEETCQGVEGANDKSTSTISTSSGNAEEIRPSNTDVESEICVADREPEFPMKVPEDDGKGKTQTHVSAENQGTGEDSLIPTGPLNDKVSTLSSTNINHASEPRDNDEETKVVESTNNPASTESDRKHENSAQGSVVEVGKRPFYWMIRIPRYDDKNIKEEINHAQLQVDEKTKMRDDIQAELRLKKADYQKYEDNFKNALSEVKAARQSLKDKKKEIESLQNAIGAEEIDSRMRYLKHMIEHETLSLKEENQLIREFNQLNKQNREQNSSNTGSQDRVQKDQVEERLKCLKKEVDLLRDKLLKAEAICQDAEKKRNAGNDEKNKLRTQFDAANDVRQQAYAHLQALREQLFEKRKHFWRYQSDAKAAAELAQKGEREDLQSHCSNQVERVMELWNNSDEFRKEYLKCNMRSTIRRLQTLDGRSLGPDEEPPVISNVVVARVAMKETNVPSPSTLNEGKTVASGETEKLHNKPVAKVLHQENQNQTAKTSKAVKSAPKVNSPAVVSARDSIEEEEQEEQKRKRGEEELARKAEALRNEQEAARLKEQRRLEEKAKAKEAMERKKRIAEKAEARAARRAQKEAEQKEKEREKRARKKDKKKTAEEDTDGMNEKEGALGSEAPVEIKDSAKEEKPVTVTKRTQKPSQFTKQTKAISVPPPLRNRSKRRMQSWMWAILVLLIVFALFVMGNNSSLIKIGLQTFGF